MDHFTPFGARVTPPPLITIRSASPLAHKSVVAIWLISTALATLSLSAAAGLGVSHLVEMERVLPTEARV